MASIPPTSRFILMRGVGLLVDVMVMLLFFVNVCFLPSISKIN